MTTEDVQYSTLAIHDQHQRILEHDTTNAGHEDIDAPGGVYSHTDGSPSTYEHRDRTSTSDHSDSLLPAQPPTPLYSPTSSHKSGGPFSWLSRFEPPKWKPIAIHTILCIITYPLLMICGVASNDRTLFLTRLIVGVGTGVTGAGLSTSLIGMSKAFIEAATWATVIHQSKGPDRPGIRLKYLDAVSGDSTDPLSALKLLCHRWEHTGTSRSSRKDYDHCHWTVCILFFVFLTVFAASIPFMLGRLVDITTILTHQTVDWEEVTIAGVISSTDFDNFDSDQLNWAFLPALLRDTLPPVVSLEYKNDTVFFSETTQSQLVPNGHRFGTFDGNAFPPTNPSLESEPMTARPDSSEPIATGHMLRFPKWGTRLHCASLPDPQNNLIVNAHSNITYVLTPHQVLRDLFSSFNLEYNETKMMRPTFDFRLTSADDGDNWNNRRNIENIFPVGFRRNPADIAISGQFYDDGICVAILSQSYGLNDQDLDRKGWISIQQILVRLNTSYTPRGTFAKLGDPIPDIKGKPTSIGYDAAICLQLIEPWIVDTYNGTAGVSSSRRLIGPGTAVQDIVGSKERRFGTTVTDTDVYRELNSTGFTGRLSEFYFYARINSMQPWYFDSQSYDNGHYEPSDVLSFITDGNGTDGYTKHSPDLFGQSWGRSDATNILPYLSGSGKLIARRFPDKVLARASIQPSWMISYLLGVLVVGLMASLLVPRLPLGVSRRGFQMYTWLAMFHANELVSSERGAGVIERNMELEDIEKYAGELRFKYVVPHVMHNEVGLP